jgi:adenine deaminase
MTDVLARRIRVARGAEPADLVVRGARVVDVLTQQVREGDVAVVGSTIAAVGASGTLSGAEVVEARGRYVAPGFIDAHVHIESSMVAPGRFADAVLPHGTTTIVSDPHEIANVLGVAGIEWMLRASEGLDLSVLMMAPACVPASPLETSGARLLAADLVGLAARHPRVLGLAEMMNYPGVLAADPVELEKLAAFSGLLVDGHAPGVVGDELQAYLGAGVVSDHECLTADEALEKVAHGMMVFLREATNARNLLDVLPAVTPANARRFAFCTDDRVPGELLDQGSIDELVRMAVGAGLDPIVAITLATLNAAEHCGLRDRGAVAPGRRADLVLFSDLGDIRPDVVIAGGRVVAREGVRVGGGEAAPDTLPPTMNVAWRDSLALARGGDRVKAIGLIEDQLITTAETASLAPGAFASPDPSADLLRLSVIERHHATGNVGSGFVRGFGLRGGALASSVAHDSHNIVVAAADDHDALVAARAAAELGGGLVVASGGEVRATVPLPLAGLMADRPPREIADQLANAESVARDLGCRVGAPFMALSFLALPVIPSLKLTDQGLVDVDAFALTDVFV